VYLLLMMRPASCKSPQLGAIRWSEEKDVGTRNGGDRRGGGVDGGENRENKENGRSGKGDERCATKLRPGGCVFGQRKVAVSTRQQHQGVTFAELLSVALLMCCGCGWRAGKAV